ncbi:sigma-70 family RNA polymerase sigma factor [Paraburkholderia bryophila]|jgi:RNA polymerase sigma-70 factor (ECF subfamily)|uniref:RNA polymerase sigma-70 factor (ECF subfamily) n=1 Tax=Paraburkholderia bryophila TaxID=420952 RepID=A0A329CVN2_9BURK|nr:sigma-70 family RNA polymerase sigma factor [Paraburkholderia bryophila]RAS37952.1 RNA polymerase sigma-70 factor (ECF subfamily) [Paraburkholderia bryophila]
MTEQVIDKASSFQAARARLFALAYRMLGSRAEAEDVVQDVWLKWHLAATQEVQTPAAWLTTLTTRTAIDRLRHVQRERASQAAGWLPEPWLDDVAPSAEELALRAGEMSYGVMLLLERLKPDERAAFVLHEAFDCDYAEIAKILERTPGACRQIVHRAKERLRRAGAPLERADPAAHARIVERLRCALEAQDRAGLLRLFSEAPEVVSDVARSAFEPTQALAQAQVLVSASASAQASVSARAKAQALISASAQASALQSAQARVQAQASASAPQALPTPIATPVFATHEPAAAGWIEKVTSLARHARHAEIVSVGGATCIALICEGEVVGVIDVSTGGLPSDSPKIVALRAVTGAARLQSANRALGRAAIIQLLARIQREAVVSVAVRRDFPVDVHA